MHTYERRVNYYETDRMGVVHHSNYIRYFEEARTHFMEEAGYPYARMEEEGVMSPVTAIACQYKKPVHYPDLIYIRVYLVSMTKFRCAFRYEVADGKTGELRATGTSEHCYLDMSGHIVNIQRQNPVFFETFLKEADGE